MENISTVQLLELQIGWLRVPVVKPVILHNGNDDADFMQAAGITPSSESSNITEKPRLSEDLGSHCERRA